MMCAPSTRSVCLSARILTKPSVVSLQRARLLAVKGNLPTRYATPASLSCSSVLPTEATRSEEHTSELQSLMRISYAVFCLKKKKTDKMHVTHNACYQHTPKYY